jgi:hypothetical protein
VTGIPAGFQFKQPHDLEDRAATNSWTGNVCMEYVADDAREQSFIRYAVFEKDSKFVNYDLGQEDIEDRCSMAGIDLTNVAEKELKDK